MSGKDSITPIGEEMTEVILHDPYYLDNPSLKTLKKHVFTRLQKCKLLVFAYGDGKKLPLDISYLNWDYHTSSLSMKLLLKIRKPCLKGKVVIVFLNPADEKPVLEYRKEIPLRGAIGKSEVLLKLCFDEVKK